MISEPKSVSIAILGCGKLGTSMLKGLIRVNDKTVEADDSSPAIRYPVGIRIIQIHATTQTASGIERIQQSLHSVGIQPMAHNVRISTAEQNAAAARSADIILLGCKPNALPSLIDEGVVRAIKGGSSRKIIVSLVGGVKIEDIMRLLGSQSQMNSTQQQRLGDPTIVRAIPNVAISLRQSATTLCSSTTGIEHPQELQDCDLISHIFSLVGSVKWLRESQMNSASALCASSLAFYAAVIKAMAKGASPKEISNEEELSPQDALELSALVAQGAASLVLTSDTPESVIEQVATKGGSTRVGLDRLEKDGMGRSLEAAVRETANATKMLRDKQVGKW